LNRRRKEGAFCQKLRHPERKMNGRIDVREVEKVTAGGSPKRREDAVGR